MKLLYAFTNWAEANDAARTLITVSSGIHHDKTVNFLGRLGFEECATGVMKTNRSYNI